MRARHEARSLAGLRRALTSQFAGCAQGTFPRTRPGDGLSREGRLLPVRMPPKSRVRTRQRRASEPILCSPGTDRR